MNDEITTFSIEALNKQFRGIEELIEPTIDDFLQEHQSYLDTIAEALAKADAKALQISAHSLKGILANLHAENARQISFTLEKMGQNGEITEAQEIFVNLKKEITQLIADIKRYFEKPT